MCYGDGCTKFAHSRGLCSTHYARLMRNGDPNKLVRRANGTGGTCNGYRTLTIDGKSVYEHRWLWEQAHGPIPRGYVVHHKNEVKLDNRLDNFALEYRGSHNKIHKSWPRKNGRWSMKHDACVVCGKTERPHISRGRCKRCFYMQTYRERVGRPVRKWVRQTGPM